MAGMWYVAETTPSLEFLHKSIRAYTSQFHPISSSNKSGWSPWWSSNTAVIGFVPLTYSRCQMSSNVHSYTRRPGLILLSSRLVVFCCSTSLKSHTLSLAWLMGWDLQHRKGRVLHCKLSTLSPSVCCWIGGPTSQKQHKGVGLRAACGNHGQHQSQQLHVTLTRKLPRHLRFKELQALLGLTEHACGSADFGHCRYHWWARPLSHKGIHQAWSRCFS